MGIEQYLWIFIVLFPFGLFQFVKYAVAILVHWKNTKDVLVSGDLGEHINELVMVHGQPEPSREIFIRHRGGQRTPALWVKNSHRKRAREGGFPRPVIETVSTTSRNTDFFLHSNGGKVFVRCLPSVVQGMKKHISRSGEHSGVQEFLPVVSQLTVMGKLLREGNDFLIVPHEKHGMLISTYTPDMASRKRLLAGVAALTGAIACAVGLLVTIIIVF